MLDVWGGGGNKKQRRVGDNGCTVVHLCTFHILGYGGFVCWFLCFFGLFVSTKPVWKSYYSFTKGGRNLQFKRG